MQLGIVNEEATKRAKEVGFTVVIDRVDEEGTEAAAATSVAISLTSMPPGITVDRPYLLAIRERLSGTILFLGAIRDPR